MNKDPRIREVEKLIEVCPDFPKPGINFKNLFPVLRDAAAFQGLIDVLVESIKTKFPDAQVIVGLESRGFLFGPQVALALGIAFVPVRKKGKLPGECIKMEYSLEYGTVCRRTDKDECEIQKNSIKPGQKVVIIDDLLATGGTMIAACDLLEAAKATILGCIVVIELTELKGREKLKHELLSFIQ